MEANTIPFALKGMGYDPDQVDRYFQKISGEYGNLQHSYTELYQKYDDLIKQTNLNRDVVAKTMMDAEARVRNMTAEAKAEADKIIENARRDLAAAQKAKALLVNEIKNMVDKLQAIGI